MWLLFACLLAAPGAHGQTVDSAAAEPVAQWTKVRIRAPLVSRGWVVGLLVRMDGDSVVLERGRRGSLSVPRWQVEQVQAESGRNHVVGALRGFGIGSLLLSVPLTIAMSGGQSSPAKESAAYTGMATAALGAGIGLLTGAFTGVQEWRKIALPPVRAEHPTSVEASSAAPPATTPPGSAEPGTAPHPLGS